MGSQYSVGPFPKEARPYANIDLVQIQARIYRFERTLDRDFTDNVFMNRKQFQWTFQLGDKATYSLFRRFDPEMKGYIPSLDLWGALVLASSCTATEKINFLFDLMDLDRDEYLSPVDLALIMRCSTRGFSNFKGTLHVPLKTVGVMVEEAFSRETVVLNESGSMHLKDLRPYLLVDDKARTYFANLGTLIVVEDSSKLIEQREDLLKELAEVENELHDLETSLAVTSEDATMYMTERGGDAHLVRLTEKLLVNVTKKANADESAAAIAQSLAGEELTKAEQQRERRQLRALRGRGPDAGSDSDEEGVSKDGGVFSRGCKQVTMTGGGGSEAAIQDAILFKWSTLKPQSKDGLVRLDLDTLLDVFEAAGISMSDEHALLCLASIPTNIIGRHNVQDVLRWLRQYQVNPPPTKVPKWRATFAQYRQRFEDLCAWSDSCLNRIIEQDRVSKEVLRYVETVNEKREALAAAEKAEKEAAVNARNKQPVLRQMSSSFAQSGRKPKKPLLGGDGSFNKFVKGSIRMSGWQKHKLNEDPSKVSLLAVFGPPIKKKKVTGGHTAKTPMEKRTMNEKKAAEEKTKWHSKIHIDFYSRPEGKKRDPLVGNDGILRDFESLTAGDIMNYFDNIGYVPELSAAEIASISANAAARAAGLSLSTEHESGRSETSGSVCWVVLNVSPGASSEEAYTLLKTATNFFQSVPLDYRHEVYTSVKSHMFYVEPPGDTSETPDTDANKGGTKYSRVIFIALLHHQDHFKRMEDRITAANLLFSRAFRSMSMDLRILKSLDDLYVESEEFCSFEQKLFGPQEDELGEEGMNPLRFAKLCRKRQQAAQEAIANAPKMTTELLREHLTMRGLSDKGNRADLIARAQGAFKRQAELVGYGEISGFGASMVQKIFEIFDQDEDAAWSLMEMNKFLVATGAETLYDSKAYKSLLQSEGFHTDNHHRLTVEGLTAYYEKYGRLARDMAMIGIGSISRCVQGEIEMRVQFEKEAFGSLFNILERNSFSQRYLKKLLGSVSVVSEFFFNGNFPEVHSLLALLRVDKVKSISELYAGIKRPGWLAHVIHKMCAWLADGDQGLLPALRKNNREVLGKYGNFIKVFEQLHMKEGVATHNSSDDVEDNGDQNQDDDTLATSEFTATSTKSESASDAPPPPPSRPLELDINDPAKRKEITEMFRIFYKNVMVKPIDADDSDVTEDEKCRPLPTRHPEIEVWEEKLSAVLPRVIGYNSARTLTVTEVNQRLAGAAAIYKRLSGNERLTRTERERLQDIKVKCEQRAMFLSAQLEESVHLCGANFIAFYDAFRLHGDGLRQFGGGTLEVGFRVRLSGIEFMHFLPPGLGEASAARQKEQDKYERAMQRKNAAMNAIERERLRRDLDEEEKAKRRRWELANVQLVRDEEEKTLFGEAYSALVGAREEILSNQEIEEIVMLWKHLESLRSERYPDTLRLAVCQNDLACVLMEIGSHRPLWTAEALSLFRECTKIIMDHIQQALEFEFHVAESPGEADDRISKRLEEIVTQAPTGSEEEATDVNALTDSDAKAKPTTSEWIRETLEPHSPASLLLLLLNSLTALRVTGNIEELVDEICVEAKEAVYTLLATLSDKEKANIHVERTMELFTILPLGDVHSQLELTLNELAVSRQDHHKKMEQERLQKRLQEYKGVGGPGRKAGLFLTKDDQRAGVDVMALVDPKKAKKIKFKREMREARKKRSVSIKQRNKMYRMIASGEISTFFEKQAKKVDEDSDVTWGDDHLANVEDPFAVSDDDESEDEDSFFSANSKKPTKSRPVDQSLSTVSFVSKEERESNQRAEHTEVPIDDDDESVGGSSDDVSELSIPTIQMQMRHLTDQTSGIKPADGNKRKNSVMSWLTRFRGTADDGR